MARRDHGRATSAPTPCPGPDPRPVRDVAGRHHGGRRPGFDLGRFYSEKRSSRTPPTPARSRWPTPSGESTDAEAEGRDVLTRNLLASPTGTVASVALAAVRGWPQPAIRRTVERHPHLRGDVRVAIKSDVSYTFGRVVGLNSAVVGGRALVKTKSAADRGAPLHQRSRTFEGPSRRATGTPTNSRTWSRRRTPRVSAARPTPRSARRPTRDRRSMPRRPTTTPNHGPIIALVGQGASPSNAASFRGFVALDIRNFQYQTPPSNVFYNGVTAGTNANTLKAMEAGWVATGYPGPDFPVVSPRLIPTTRSGSSTATRRASSSTPSTRVMTPEPRSSRRCTRARSRASRTSATRCRAPRRSTRTRTATTRSR